LEEDLKVVGSNMKALEISEQEVSCIIWGYHKSLKSNQSEIWILIPS